MNKSDSIIIKDLSQRRNIPEESGIIQATIVNMAFLWGRDIGIGEEDQ